MIATVVQTAAPVVHAAAPVVVAHPIVHAVTHTVVQWWQVDHLRGITVQLLIFLTGVSASFVHWLFSRDRLSRSQNIALLHVYSFILAGLEVLAKGQLHLATLGTAYLETVGAATAMYAILYSAVSAKRPKQDPAVDAKLPIATTLQ